MLIISKNNKSINLGIEILRMLLCLWIVFIHCSIIKEAQKKYLSKGFHVPTFILISFFFYVKTLQGRIIYKIIYRFKRILIPYIGWSIIILIINNLKILVFGYGLSHKILSLQDLYLQLLTGSNYYRIFWFQFNLIFLSLFLTIISFIFKSNLLLSFYYLAVISFYMHISRLNHKFVIQLGNKYIRKSCGSLIELMPISIFGCIISSSNLLSETKKNPLSILFLYIFLLYIFFNYEIFINYRGFRGSTSNILLNIFVCTILLLFFGSLNFDKVKYYKLYIFIQLITKNTGGIYYIHEIVRDHLKIFSHSIKDGTYFGALIIYLFSYLICFFGNRLLKNHIFRYLFI